MKKLVSLILAAALAATLWVPASAANGLPSIARTAEYTAGQFEDVPAGSWCADNVQAVCQMGLMSGKSASIFDPSGPLTVAQTVVIACRLNNAYNGGRYVFGTSEPWYQTYVDYAEARNILPMKIENYQTPVTRAGFAMIMGAALPDGALPEINEVEEGAIPDVEAGSSYYEAVYRLYRAGILTGNDAKGTFTPFSGITRGAAAAIVSRMAEPTLRKSFTLECAPFEPVPMNQLANLKSLRRRASDDELRQAYDIAVEIVTPLAKLPREEQLYYIAVILRNIFESGMSYSMDSAHYNDPYGYLVEGVASCAGCTRTTGLCLNILGIPYEHVNENQYSHQWCRVKIGDEYWITDAYGLYVGPEPAPYMHPYF